MTTVNLKNTLRNIFNFWDEPDFIFLFDWRDLSAGESALLTIFSRLHKVSTWYTLKETIWILIDESELYFHPEWQRIFLHDLHKYLPVFFAKKKMKIQLFITSHSPFIVSDLPKENIIFLDKYKPDDEEVKARVQNSGFCKIISPEKMEETFGQNIHTLLSDSFFMSEGIIGKFAEKKINEILNFYHRIKLEETNENPTMEKFKEEYVNNIERFKKIQEIIGEPIISNVIKNHINEIESIFKRV